MILVVWIEFIEILEWIISIEISLHHKIYMGPQEMMYIEIIKISDGQFIYHESNVYEK